MKISRITSSNDSILKSFPELYESSFPEDERVDSQKMISLIDKCPQMEFNAIVEDEDDAELSGIAVIWNLQSCRYLLYLAMREDKRNQGYGTEVLKYLLQQSYLPIIAEVERPFNEMNRRRIEFYRRNGFNIELENPKILNENHYHPTCILQLISSQPLEDADLCQREVVEVVYSALTQ